MLYWTHCPIIAIYWIICPMIRERLAKTSKLAFFSNFVKIAAYSVHRTILVGKNTVPGQFYFSGTLVGGGVWGGVWIPQDEEETRPSLGVMVARD